ncbi:SubName: Full=Related to glyoxal oxidase {ECO:0000313/EMBL:CCA74028.1} [Serendipita indica DSM 11827]|nr:SubName: Full=Related to glyoxal oxidase {ECO:0000313/EMBL:CCA74028.1} [Serendipita indica DSM 11827]
MSCSGDMSTVCGGSDRLTVYKYQGTDLTPAPVVLESYNGFASQGCYADSVQARIMTPISLEGLMTMEKCTDACVAAGYEVAGAEFGQECYCSSSLPAESFKVTDNCDMSCAGDYAHICGGSNRLSAYRDQGTVSSTSTQVMEPSTSVGSSATFSRDNLSLSTGTTTSAMQTATSSSWLDIGCTTELSLAPAATHFEMKSLGHVSHEACGIACFQYDYSYFAFIHLTARNISS